MPVDDGQDPECEGDRKVRSTGLYYPFAFLAKGFLRDRIYMTIGACAQLYSVQECALAVRCLGVEKVKGERWGYDKQGEN